MPEQHVTSGDHVVLRLPASGAYLSVLRTAAAGLASRLDFTIDDIEDLKIAIDEACAMLLPRGVEGADLTCRFDLHDDVLDIAVSLATVDSTLPSRDTFAWTVLSALAGEVDATVEDGEITIRLSKHREALIEEVGV
ncbi:MAG TPA: anti-sigma regulatory factor [Mycobacteriales bacterium]|nr:anti-sigma regulatory factor [Mycobacteriales bacterium]